jgi:hypothetical protein
MLFVSAEFTKPKRVQGAYIGEKEVKHVVDFFKQQTGAIIYNEEIIEKPKRGLGVPGMSDGGAIVGNAGNLNDALALRNDAAAYLVFDPVQVVLHPYASPWDDAQRRQYFWEYLFRSAFSGEFDFGDAHRAMQQWMLIGMLASLCVLAPIGIAWSLLRAPRRSSPMLLLLALSLGAHAAFRWKYPYSSSQDFRYSTLLSIPLAAFALIGAEKLPPSMQRAALYVFQFACALEAMIIVTL